MRSRHLAALAAVVLAACSGDDDGGGGGGTVTAAAVLGGEEIDFAQPCEMPERDADWNVYASGGEPHLGFDLIWDKEAVDGPGTHTISLTAGITLYVELDDTIEGIEMSAGSVTFETHRPEDGVVSGTFDVTVEDAGFAATGSFDCM